jgi:putative iron-only hydrogenase system regulator
MENKVALIGIVVENFEKVGELNAVLHEYADYIIGRMGLPYKKRDVSIISVAIDAPGDVINALSGKIGKLSGVTSKTVYAKLDEE